MKFGKQIFWPQDGCVLRSSPKEQSFVNHGSDTGAAYDVRLEWNGRKKRKKSDK